jgi:hypothetical protein
MNTLKSVWSWTVGLLIGIVALLSVFLKKKPNVEGILEDNNKDKVRVQENEVKLKLIGDGIKKEEDKRKELENTLQEEKNKQNETLETLNNFFNNNRNS